MKINVLGFSWDPKKLPKNLPAAEAFAEIAQVSGKKFAKYIGAAVQHDGLWKGVLLKIKDRVPSQNYGTRME
jgi:hypothetical protein